MAHPKALQDRIDAAWKGIVQAVRDAGANVEIVGPEPPMLLGQLKINKMDTYFSVVPQGPSWYAKADTKLRVRFGPFGRVQNMPLPHPKRYDEVAGRIIALVKDERKRAAIRKKQDKDRAAGRNLARSIEQKHGQAVQVAGADVMFDVAYTSRSTVNLRVDASPLDEATAIKMIKAFKKAIGELK